MVVGIVTVRLLVSLFYAPIVNLHMSFSFNAELVHTID